MIVTYPTLSKELRDRAGQTWIRCDVSTCSREVEVKAGVSLTGGWVTSDPLGDPLRGAAQFCPDHASRLSPPYPR